MRKLGIYTLSSIAIASLVVWALGCQAKASNELKPTGVEPTSQPVHAATTITPYPKFSSEYTKLDAKTCKPIRKAANKDDEVPDICTGLKDYKIFVSHHGTATRISIGREVTSDPNSWDATAMPQFIANLAGSGQVIEWRLADGEPFACIVRAQYDRQIVDPEKTGKANELVVRNLKGFAPIEIVIDAEKTTDANNAARNQADAAYRKL